MDKNIIRIKDFPSNTIDEAILILKENKRAKKYECSSKFKSINDKNESDESMVIKEAEFIISDYLDKDESNKKSKSKKIIKKLRIINVILSFALIISIIL
ncbi:MAG: hypothetical protein IKE91_02540 [Clostridia bacterium]|nr:hypothetical protein [Clostridia bacterium]